MESRRLFLIVFRFLGLSAVIAALFLAVPVYAYAQPVEQGDGDNQCLVCHENLYYLYDTGKWYCLHESPMACSHCHGGNPDTFHKEDAHLNRAAHPVINENDKKCYECHPATAESHLDEFRQVAGISQVMVAIPYQPAAPLEFGAAVEKSGFALPLLGVEAFTFLLVTSLALAAFLASKIRHG
jgi:hypothetical protein